MSFPEILNIEHVEHIERRQIDDVDAASQQKLFESLVGRPHVRRHEIDTLDAICLKAIGHCASRCDRRRMDDRR